MLSVVVAGGAVFAKVKLELPVTWMSAGVTVILTGILSGEMTFCDPLPAPGTAETVIVQLYVAFGLLAELPAAKALKPEFGVTKSVPWVAPRIGVVGGLVETVRAMQLLAVVELPVGVGG
jgi:hypothetical protein